MTDDNTPIWFLDVDGVINAIALACPSGFQEGMACPDDSGMRFKIQWDPKVIEWINKIHDSGAARVMWLTTWGSGANGELRELIGINELEVAGEPDDYLYSASPSRWWKWHVVREFYEKNPDRKYVWTDDDLHIEREALDWTRGKNFFTISPPMHKSLGLNDLQTIQKFLEA